MVDSFSHVGHSLEVVVATLDATFTSAISQFGTLFAFVVVRSCDRTGRGERLIKPDKVTRELTDDDGWIR